MILVSISFCLLFKKVRNEGGKIKKSPPSCFKIDDQLKFADRDFIDRPLTQYLHSVIRDVDHLLHPDATDTRNAVLRFDGKGHPLFERDRMLQRAPPPNERQFIKGH